MSGSKLVFAIFLIIILSLGGLLGFYFYLNRSNTLNQSPVASNKPAFNGFDQVTLDNSNENSKNNTDLGTYAPATTTATTSTTSVTPVFDEDLLRLISAKPVTGFDFIVRNVDISTSSAPIGTSTQQIKLALKNKKIVPIEFIRYVQKATGNIFETGTSSTSTTDRITNKTIPKLQESFFNSSGDEVIIRNIFGDDAIQTRLLSLKPDQTQGTSTLQNTSSVDLFLNITETALSPDKTKIFYTRNNGPRGVISNLDGSGKISIFDSPFREWLPQWETPTTILLNTKPSGLAYGYLYSLNSKTGFIKKILGGITGLTSLGSNDGQNILYTNTQDNQLETSLLDTKTGANWVLPLGTLPEKCVWGNKYTKILYCAVPKTVSTDHVYPDDWYLGLMHFNDSVWRINTVTGENKLIVDPTKQIPFTLDITNMKISNNDDYLMFEDKNTLSLWGIGLKSPIIVATSTPAVKTPTKK